MKLLVVEDNPELCSLLQERLKKEGFAIDAFHEAEDAHSALETTRYDCVVLDLGLPDGDGLDILTQLRAKKNMTPVLILTARDGLEDRVKGLNLGADDYCLKPFEMDELIARIRALLRRPGGALGVELCAGNLTFDTVSREVQIAGDVVALARRELDVLEELMRRYGRVVSKQALEESLYGFNEDVGSNSVEAHISRLRKKLNKTQADVSVHTIRGVGYILADNSDDD
ncbi:DNA-binding response regulator in two-component regulatory system with QseC [Candidatus Terasakiella magnetica]|uniref:DNA-binding response regulator in two-component regulatory system with QseC n=1 Tax=Candidatus Terasakiella magnetica TaxID=1867952 RepID=A0A1C3RHW2_9PROT|nr:response regulator transcription factor [Candidatus Terasakiella magnetica]SCA56867.1 DNA-binding response regulator in two-component regulatory system with QseC [Candidatus Terasakiella magnetica]